MNKNCSVRLAQNDFEFIFCEIKKRFIKNKVISFLSKETDNEKKLLQIIYQKTECQYFHIRM